MVKIAPSILSADYKNLAGQIALAEQGGADLFHIDVMDGHFVPNITIGPVVLSAVRRCTDLPLDVHLMIDRPNKFVKAFAMAGADYITVHVEANHDIAKTIAAIKALRKKPGVVVKPSTPLSAAVSFLKKVDILLVMSVDPGFAGQKFMPEALPKIKAAREYINKYGLDVQLEVDGGINVKTAPMATKAGADILVAGSAIFGGRIKDRIKSIRKAVKG